MHFFQTATDNHTNISTFYGLHFLRIVAASMVAARHSFELLDRVGQSTLPSKVNFSGVDIFFVLSGFLLCLLTAQRKETQKSFLINRFTRIVPYYWLVILFMTALIVCMPQLFHSSGFDWSHFFASMLFIGWEHPVMGSANPIYQPGWTLNLEMFFYVLLSFLLFLPLGKRITVLSAILLILGACGVLFPSDNPTIQFYTMPIMIEFAFGAIAAYWFITSRRVPTVSLSYLLLILGTVLLVASFIYWPMTRLSPDRFLVRGVPSLMILLGVVYLDYHRKIPQIRFSKLLADASYGVYLTHMFTIGIVGVAWKNLALKDYLPDHFIIITCFFASWIVGILFHVVLEKRTMTWTRKALERKSEASST